MRQSESLGCRFESCRAHHFLSNAASRGGACSSRIQKRVAARACRLLVGNLHADLLHLAVQILQYLAVLTFRGLVPGTQLMIELFQSHARATVDAIRPVELREHRCTGLLYSRAYPWASFAAVRSCR